MSRSYLLYSTQHMWSAFNDDCLNDISLEESESKESVSTRREEEDSTQDVADIIHALIDYSC